MTHIDEQGRPEPALAAGELETLVGFLDFQRATLEWKTRGLDAVALDTRIATSAMTLGGLLKHLAWVEDHWFSYRLLGADPAEPWASADFEADQDWEWTSAATTSPAELRELLAIAIARSRAATARVVEGAEGPDGLGVLEARGYRDGSRVSLRWILVHMIEEYARHNGHADVLREAIDGETGE